MKEEVPVAKQTCNNCRFWFMNDGTRYSLHECFTDAGYRCPDWKVAIAVKMGESK